MKALRRVREIGAVDDISGKLVGFATMLGRDWVKATGTVVEVSSHETKLADGAAGVWYDGFVVDVHPRDVESFRAEVREPGHAIGSFVIDSLNFKAPSKGDTVSVEFDPKTKKTRFDMSDPRLQERASRKARDKAQHAEYEAALQEAPSSGPRSAPVPDAPPAAKLDSAGKPPSLTEIMAARGNPAAEALRNAASPAFSGSVAQAPLEQRLANLQQLRNDGVLSPDEYAAQRQRILDSL
jgi:hypothetical protein